MKKNSYPTRIRLNEIPEAGDNFEYSKDSGELTEALKDLIGSKDYSVSVHLRPMGNVYEIACDLKTSMTVNCSRCGRPTDQPIQESTQELLVIEEKRPRNAKSASKSQESLEDSSTLFCNYIPSDNFDLAEFIHEQIASNEPFIVECGKSDCNNVLENFQDKTVIAKSNPFEALKDLKL